MRIIDAQVHVYERDSARRPWRGRLHGPDEVTGADQIALMDAHGVDGAVCVSTWSTYHDDTSYAQEVHASFPGRFRLVAPIDVRIPGAGARVAAWAKVPGAAGIRILLVTSSGRVEHDDVDLTGAIRAAAEHGLPVCLHAWGHPELVDQVARSHPSAQLVLDHLGLPQPLTGPAPAAPFDDLPKVLALAGHPNLHVKLTGVCTMSTLGHPFEDIWQPVASVLGAFGAERCLWGTDWTRAQHLVSYVDALTTFARFMPMSPEQRAAIMGGTAMRLFGWDDVGN